MDSIKRRKFTVKEWMRELELDIKAAEKQAGYPLDEDISDGDPDDEDLRDARPEP